MIDDDTQPDSIESLVRAAAPTGFADGFADRVLSRVRAEREAPVATALERQFRRVVPMLAAASLVLAGYNWWTTRETAGSAIEAALRLPRVSLATAYSTSALLDVATGAPELP